MTTASRKSLWWALLFAALGSVLFFTIMVAASGNLPSGREKGIYAWPLIGMILIPIALLKLRAAYRLEPATKLQFSISDLLVAGFAVGILLSIFQTTMPKHFFVLGLPYTFLIASAMPLGGMAANSDCCHNSSARALFAIGFSMRLIGSIAGGGLLMLLLTLTPVIGADEVLTFARDILSFSENTGRYRSDWLPLMFRLGLIFLACGVAFCRTARALNAPVK